MCATQDGGEDRQFVGAGGSCWEGGRGSERRDGKDGSEENGKSEVVEELEMARSEFGRCELPFSLRRDEADLSFARLQIRNTAADAHWIARRLEWSFSLVEPDWVGLAVRGALEAEAGEGELAEAGVEWEDLEM